MKIVINKCYGGWGLSKEAYEFLGLEWDGYGYTKLERTDPNLIKCIETLGNRASGQYSSLKVIEIPDDVEWEIEEYDGVEWVSEKHRTWG